MSISTAKSNIEKVWKGCIGYGCIYLDNLIKWQNKYNKVSLKLK